MNLTFFTIRNSLHEIDNTITIRSFFESKSLWKKCKGNTFTLSIRKLLRRHPLSMYAKFFQKVTFLTPWYAHVRGRIRELEMLVFRKILRTYLMDGPFLTFTHLLFSQKSSIVDFWQGPKWASGSHLFGYMTYCVKISQRMRKIHRYNITFINVINFFVPLRELWENSEVNFFSETCFKCVSQENWKARQLKNWPFVQENRE